MQIKIFVIPIGAEEHQEEELNDFVKPNEQNSSSLEYSAMARNRTFKNDFVKPNEQNSSSLEYSAMARNRTFKNDFLRANKIIDIKKELAQLNGNSCWTFCITYMQANRPTGTIGETQAGKRKSTTRKCSRLTCSRSSHRSVHPLQKIFQSTDISHSPPYSLPPTNPNKYSITSKRLKP